MLSVKLPESVSLKYVDDRCKLLQPIHKNIFCTRYGDNILTVRYKNFTYILFKKSSKRNPPPQHCNITKIKSESEIQEAIGDLFVIINQPPVWLPYTIDNYSCTAKANQRIDIVKLYMNETRISCNYNVTLSPSLTIYSPKGTSEKSANLCSLVYGSGKIILVGGNNLNEIEKFLYWVLEIARNYKK